MPNGVLLYPSTLDASLRTMLLVLSYSVVASAFIPPDESIVDFLRGYLRNGPPSGVFMLSRFSIAYSALFEPLHIAEFAQLLHIPNYIVSSMLLADITRFDCVYVEGIRK